MIGAVRHSVNTATWIPRELFTGGYDGFWYDPTDLGSMFQDTAGTTAVGANNDPVGLIRDKSGRGNHATRQNDDTHRPTWVASTNGRPYLAFAASNSTTSSGLSVGGLGICRNKGYFTFVMGITITTVPAPWSQGIVFISNNSAGGTRLQVQTTITTGVTNLFARRLDADSAVALPVSPALVSGVNVVLLCEADYASQNGTILQGIGQTSVFGTFPSSTAGTTSDTDSAEIAIGNQAAGGGGAAGLNGRIYGIIAISRKLQQGERLQALRWMSGKTIGRYN